MGLEPSYYFRFCQSTQSLDALHLHGIHKHLQKLCNFTNAPKFTPTPKLQTFQLLKKKLTPAFVMVEVWWSLLAAIPAVVAGHAFRVKKRRAEEQRLKTARGREKSSDEIFVCERVCTSKRMLKKVGAFSKDPIPDTCVTVCGVSELDACADACARTVCVNQHQVPNWNDICLRRCQSECLKLSSSSSL